MKKKFLLICMAAMLALSLTACGGNDKKEDKKADKKEESVKKEEKDIELTLPASFFDEEGMADINEEAKAEGVKEVKVNDDGSVTYKMDKSTHEKLLKEMKKGIDESISELLEDKENYSSFTEITYNDDVTEFKIMVDPAAYGGLQSFGALVMYAAGNMYQGMNLVPEEEINTTVQFINKDTQEVIESGDSKSMADEYEGTE
ncbi:hypothetical protein [[Clostridium] hylemonae]|uniref:hypothetical protein n=1 Tax=[Clostridium] hylemonae TaxID=89153 RepID=UPI001106AD22|nr:hypothetical protein [[Clostridium] hylemonae]BDF03687.1 hypothetical protein CE91St63_07490 [[Clostridium] hylemonae]